MASGAQLNRWGDNGGVIMLPSINTATTAVTPLQNGVPTGYGTTSGGGPNDSGAFVTPIGMQTWTFHLCPVSGVPAGYTVSIYGLLDPIAYAAYSDYTGTANLGVASEGYAGGGLTGGSGAKAIPALSWFLIPGPSEQSGTGQIANPLTSQTPLFQAKIALVAVRAVVTGSTNPSGVCKLIGFAVP